MGFDGCLLAWQLLFYYGTTFRVSGTRNMLREQRSCTSVRAGTCFVFRRCASVPLHNEGPCEINENIADSQSGLTVRNMLKVPPTRAERVPCSDVEKHPTTRLPPISCASTRLSTRPSHDNWAALPTVTISIRLLGIHPTIGAPSMV